MYRVLPEQMKYEQCIVFYLFKQEEKLLSLNYFIALPKVVKVRIEIPIDKIIRVSFAEICKSHSYRPQSFKHVERKKTPISSLTQAIFTVRKLLIIRSKCQAAEKSYGFLLKRSPAENEVTAFIKWIDNNLNKKGWRFACYTEENYWLRERGVCWRLRLRSIPKSEKSSWQGDPGGDDSHRPIDAFEPPELQRSSRHLWAFLNFKEKRGHLP